MLQSVAVCCSALQCVAVCCSVMQCVAECCLQCVAMWDVEDVSHTNLSCCFLSLRERERERERKGGGERVSARERGREREREQEKERKREKDIKGPLSYLKCDSHLTIRMSQRVAVCCSVLQSVAECCSVLQRVAECFDVSHISQFEYHTLSILKREQERAT